MAKQKTFTPEFKDQSASLVLDSDYTVKEACEATGVSKTAMRDWVKRLRQERHGITPTKGKAITPEHQEIQLLKARVKRLELEKEILKKASALLMSDSMKSFK